MQGAQALADALVVGGVGVGRRGRWQIGQHLCAVAGLPLVNPRQAGHRQCKQGNRHRKTAQAGNFFQPRVGAGHVKHRAGAELLLVGQQAQVAHAADGRAFVDGLKLFNQRLRLGHVANEVKAGHRAAIAQGHHGHALLRHAKHKQLQAALAPLVGQVQGRRVHGLARLCNGAAGAHKVLQTAGRIPLHALAAQLGQGAAHQFFGRLQRAPLHAQHKVVLVKLHP